jgi:hypothetical protein
MKQTQILFCSEEFFSAEFIVLEKEMEQSESSAAPKIITLEVRGKRQTNQSLEKIGGKIIAVGREIGHMNEDTKTGDSTTL